MAGIPVEALLAADDTRTVSYAPSATVFKYLREQPRPDRHAGLLALGDPVYEQPDKSSEPQAAARPRPAGQRGRPWLERRDPRTEAGGCLAGLQRPGAEQEGRPQSRCRGRQADRRRGLERRPVVPRELAPGKLGVVIDPRPAPVAIAEQRKLQQVLVAARGGDEDFAPLPGTRYEVEALARLFKSDDRPTRTLLGADASEPELDRLAASGELGRFGFIHLATHGVIDEGDPAPLGGDPDPDRPARPAASRS